jgi:hypothetical protein
LQLFALITPVIALKIFQIQQSIGVIAIVNVLTPLLIGLGIGLLSEANPNVKNKNLGTIVLAVNLLPLVLVCFLGAMLFMLSGMFTSDY